MQFHVIDLILPAVGQRESQAYGLALRDSDGWDPVIY